MAEPFFFRPLYGACLRFPGERAFIAKVYGRLLSPGKDCFRWFDYQPAILNGRLRALLAFAWREW